MFTFPFTINICGKLYNCTRDNDITGAQFDFHDRTIIIGDCADHALSDYLIHEISEIIHVILGTRLSDAGNNNYMFVMNHNSFQTHNEILIETLLSNGIISFNYKKEIQCHTEESQ